MKRRTGIFFFGLCSLAFVLGFALWARSQFVGEGIMWTSRQWDSTQQPAVFVSRIYAIQWSRGVVAIGREADEYQRWFSSHGGQPPGLAYFRMSPAQSVMLANSSDNTMNLQLGGFQWACYRRSASDGWTTIQRLVVPLWLFFFAAIPPVLWWLRRRRKGRGFEITVAKASDQGGNGSPP